MTRSPVNRSPEGRAQRRQLRAESEERLLAVLGQFGPQTFAQLGRKALPNVPHREVDNRVKALAHRGEIETRPLVLGGHPHWHITDQGRRRIHLPARSAPASPAVPPPDSPRPAA